MLSVVVPVLNEEDTLPELYRRLAAALVQEEHEILFVDDGSRDGSWASLHTLAGADPRIRLLRLSRHWGRRPAITAGLDAARGEAVVVMDGDLQDPPELITQLLARWREGDDVVYAVRAERAGESPFKRATASLYYKLLRRLSGSEIPADAGDFRLMSRRVVDALAAMPERARFLRGMTSRSGSSRPGSVPPRRV
jgi:dolichol-phosphate mannosyltransferase